MGVVFIFLDNAFLSVTFFLRGPSTHITTGVLLSYFCILIIVVSLFCFVMGSLPCDLVKKLQILDKHTA